MAGVHGRLTRVVIEGTDLSCQLREASLSLTQGTLDATPFCAGAREYIADFPDARATVAGFYDSSVGGTLHTLMPLFGHGNELRGIILDEGHAVGKVSKAFSGILTNFSKTNTVSDIQMLQLDTQVNGEVFIGPNLLDFTVPFTAGDPDRIVGRVADLPAPYNVAGTYSGLLYAMFKNTTAAPIELTIGTGASDMGPFTDLLTSGEVAPGEVFAGVVGTYSVPLAIGSHLEVALDPAPAGNEQVNVSAIMVDRALSLLRT